MLLPTVRESIMGPVPGDYSKFLLKSWATEYPPWWREDEDWPQLYTAFRARVLHALYPADRTLLMRVTNPIYLFVMMLKFNTYTVVPVFAFQFLMIEKKDEFQLIGYILSFKVYQFLTGVYYACSLATTFYVCLGSTGYVAGEPRTCDAMTGIDTEPAQVATVSEIFRYLLIVAAAFLLHSGYARGGTGELKALAEVRIDVADGSLDGFADTGRVEMDLVRGTKRCRHVTASELAWAIERARVKFNAEPADGNYLPSFLVLDSVTAPWLELSTRSVVVISPGDRVLTCGRSTCW